MLSFVNAKINIGLFITSRRPDGYHDLETLFYPVGTEEGLADSPESATPFCDLLEVVPAEEDMLILRGRPVDCPLEKNLVWRAMQLFRSRFMDRFGNDAPAYAVTLMKNLPDGAGLGGGSADASFTLTSLNQLQGNPFSREELEEMALRLGADCPFFIRNIPSYASGVGECLQPIGLSLDGWWIVIAKPYLHISTREAFSGILPQKAPLDLREIASLSPAEWRGAGVGNQFETTLFSLYPQLGEMKNTLYESGAAYASMSGSGAALYGIYPDKKQASEAIMSLPSTLEGVWLLKLK